MKTPRRGLKKAAENGHVEAQNAYGDCLYFGPGVKQSYSDAVKWYKTAAENGLSEAQYNLGFCLYNGQGAFKDVKSAEKWYSMAMRQGNKNALAALKEMGK